MSKNKEIKKLVDELLPMMDLKDKNYLIGFLQGMKISIQNHQKETS